MKTTLHNPLRRLGIVAVIAAALGVALAAPASAHTRLISSSPGREATVAPPTKVSLVFSDKISSAKVIVKDGRGKAHQSGAPRLDGTKVAQDLTGRLPAGSYTIAWRVVGADGHPITSENPLTFTVDAAAEPESGGGPVAQEDVTTEPPVAPKEAVSAGTHRAVEKSSDSGGGVSWLMIGSGLLLGAGIGFAFVFMRKRKPTSTDSE